MESALIVALACVLGFAGGLGGGVLVLHRSGPVASAKALAELARVRMDWEAWRTGAEGVLEAMDELHDVIHRKRNRISARESKEARDAERAASGNGAADPKADLRNRARAAGLSGF